MAMKIGKEITLIGRELAHTWLDEVNHVCSWTIIAVQVLKPDEEYAIVIRDRSTLVVDKNELERLLKGGVVLSKNGNLAYNLAPDKRQIDWNKRLWDAFLYEMSKSRWMTPQKAYAKAKKIVEAFWEIDKTD